LLEEARAVADRMTYRQFAYAGYQTAYTPIHFKRGLMYHAQRHYLPGHWVSSAFDQWPKYYHFVIWLYVSLCVNNLPTAQRSYMTVKRPGVEPATSRSPKPLNHQATTAIA